jgi:hypothetical protein
MRVKSSICLVICIGVSLTIASSAMAQVIFSVQVVIPTPAFNNRSGHLDIQVSADYSDSSCGYDNPCPPYEPYTISETTELVNFSGGEPGVVVAKNTRSEVEYGSRSQPDRAAVFNISLPIPSCDTIAYGSWISYRIETIVYGPYGVSRAKFQNWTLYGCKQSSPSPPQTTPTPAITTRCASAPIWRWGWNRHKSRWDWRYGSHAGTHRVCAKGTSAEALVTGHLKVRLPKSGRWQVQLCVGSPYGQARPTCTVRTYGPGLLERSYSRRIRSYHSGGTYYFCVDIEQVSPRKYYWGGSPHTGWPQGCPTVALR